MGNTVAVADLVTSGNCTVKQCQSKQTFDVENRKGKIFSYDLITRKPMWHHIIILIQFTLLYLIELLQYNSKIITEVFNRYHSCIIHIVQYILIVKPVKKKCHKMFNHKIMTLYKMWENSCSDNVTCDYLGVLIRMHGFRFWIH